MKSKLYTILACLLLIGLTTAYFFISRERELRRYNAKAAAAKVASVETKTSTSLSSSSSIPPADSDSILLINTGDMMFDRAVRARMAKGIDPFAHMDDIKSEIQDDFGLPIDVTIANLEGPITDAAVCQKKAYSFKFASTTGDMLRENGIDIVSLSNNHSFDCFAQGVVDTRKNLTTARVGFMGGGGDINNSVYIKTIKGKSFAFVGIDETVRPIPIEDFYPFIQNLAAQHDAVIVNIHWGVEYQKQPTSSQKSIGHKLIDSGAIAVIGHHPHVTEPFELYNGGVIYYSLGNFIFDQVGVEENKGGVAAIHFDIGKGSGANAKTISISDAKMLPVQIVNSVPCGVSCTHE